MNFASHAMHCALCCFLMASAAVAADARLSGGPSPVRAHGGVPAESTPSAPAQTIVGIERPAPIANGGPVANGTLTPLPAGPAAATMPVVTMPTIVTPPTGVAVIGPAGTTAGANVSNQFHSLTQMPSGSANTNMPLLPGSPGGASAPPAATGPAVTVPAAPTALSRP